MTSERFPASNGWCAETNPAFQPRTVPVIGPLGQWCWRDEKHRASESKDYRALRNSNQAGIGLFRSAFEFFDQPSIFAIRAKNLPRARGALRTVHQKTAGNLRGETR
jgi:hypothetical protein